MSKPSHRHLINEKLGKLSIPEAVDLGALRPTAPHRDGPASRHHAIRAPLTIITAISFLTLTILLIVAFYSSKGQHSFTASVASYGDFLDLHAQYGADAIVDCLCTRTSTVEELWNNHEPTVPFVPNHNDMLAIPKCFIDTLFELRQQHFIDQSFSVDRAGCEDSTVDEVNDLFDQLSDNAVSFYTGDFHPLIAEIFNAETFATFEGDIILEVTDSAAFMYDALVPYTLACIHGSLSNTKSTPLPTSLQTEAAMNTFLSSTMSTACSLNMQSMVVNKINTDHSFFDVQSYWNLIDYNGEITVRAACQNVTDPSLYYECDWLDYFVTDSQRTYKFDTVVNSYLPTMGYLTHLFPHFETTFSDQIAAKFDEFFIANEYGEQARHYELCAPSSCLITTNENLSSVILKTIPYLGGVWTGVLAAFTFLYGYLINVKDEEAYRLEYPNNVDVDPTDTSAKGLASSKSDDIQSLKKEFQVLTQITLKALEARLDELHKNDASQGNLSAVDKKEDTPAANLISISNE